MSSAEPIHEAHGDDLTAKAEALAAAVTGRLEAGATAGIAPEAIQALAAALCRAYGADQDAGRTYPILAQRGAASGTDVMVACSALLKSADLQVFELGMWSSWTGR